MRKIVILLLTICNLQAEVPTYENVTRLYIATFERVPDMNGLNYWVNDSGLSLEAIAMSFFEQPETREKYPEGIIVGDFVDEVYINLFDRAPDEEGYLYWVDALNRGDVYYAQYILAVINGAQGSDAQVLLQKTAYALNALGLHPDTPVLGPEKELAVRRTNEIRAELYAGYTMSWDEALAASAQKYADILARSGEFEHSRGEGYGENLYAASHISSYTDAINTWYEEKKYYHYADNSCTAGEQCGHYTQLVWQNASKFGCGKAVYQTGRYEGWVLIVCQYTPPGNYIGQKPY